MYNLPFAAHNKGKRKGDYFMRYQKEKNLFSKPNSKLYAVALTAAAVLMVAAVYMATARYSAARKNETDTTTGDTTLWSTKEPISPASKNDTSQKKPSASPQGDSSLQTQPSSQQDLSKGQDLPQTSQTSPKPQYILPVNGEIINSFSGDQLVKDATLGDWRTHNGIDIGCTGGKEVYAFGDGTVQNIEDTDLWGTVVTVDFTGGYTGRYCLLAKVTAVKIGQKIKMGDLIGAVGDGKSAINESALPIHLHFELQKDGKYVDPTVLITN